MRQWRKESQKKHEPVYRHKLKFWLWALFNWFYMAVKKHNPHAISRRGRAPFIGIQREVVTGRRLTPKEQGAFKEVQLLYASSGKWAHRSSIVAGKIIAICARHGVPVQTILENFARRVPDVAVIHALEKRMSFLEKSNNAKKKGKKSK